MENYSYSYEEPTSKSYSLAKVFGYMFLGLLVTAGIAIGLYYLLINSSISPESYYVLVTISGISTFILVLFAQVFTLKGKAKGGMITYILYAISMGILLSSFLLIYDIKFLAFIFLCTSGVFGVMALYALLTKRNTLSLGMVGTGLLFGAITLSLVNFFLGSVTLYYIISYISLAAMLAITAFDINQAKRLATYSNGTESLAIYMALQLYTDFVYIFIRLVVLLGRNRN